jgi:hypothetical protein
MGSADACGPTHSSYALGPWTPPPPRRLVWTPFGPPFMYVRFTNAVRTLLIPAAQPTVRARRLQDLGPFPLFAGSFGPRDDPPPCTYVLQVLYTLY